MGKYILIIIILAAACSSCRESDQPIRHSPEIGGWGAESVNDQDVIAFVELTDQVQTKRIEFILNDVLPLEFAYNIGDTLYYSGVDSDDAYLIRMDMILADWNHFEKTDTLKLNESKYVTIVSEDDIDRISEK